jgi:hypothetical protein
MNEHLHIFDDVIRSIAGGLGDLGYDCSINQNEMELGKINIVLGSVIFLPAFGDAANRLTARPYVLYQLEQLSDDVGHARDFPGYWRILQRANHILEYAPYGMGVLDRLGLSDRTSFFPPAHHRSLERFSPAPEQDIDVLFYGSYSDRRNAVLDQLRAAGVKVVGLFGVYGDALDAYLRRAKIVLNVHMWPGLSVLETVRLSYLLANRCFVVSEFGDYNPYADGLAFAKYDDLAPLCLRWLDKGAPARQAVAEAGYRAIRRTDMTSQLKTLIERLSLDELLSAHNRL